ncbi:uncharacterized protein LOC102713550 [Oryza brachyantha]|nr:uncharacterized protein LOC102713550 [Oryza brachyantha]
MLAVSRSWRTSLREPPVRPLPPQLPWLLRPSAGGPTFSCLLSGADEDSVHRFRVPGDLRAARYFGSYDGGWLFLAYGQNLGHTLVNLCNGRRFRLPDVVPWPTKAKEFPVIMLAATLSSPPSYTDDRCFGAAIVHCSPYMSGARHMTFWIMGDRLARLTIHPEIVYGLSDMFYEEMEDVIYHNGAFCFLSILENVLVCTPVLHQGDLQIQEEWLRFFRQDDGCSDRPVALARYLVESRGQLLMVLKRKCDLAGWPPLVFSVFQMMRDQQVAVWIPVVRLEGRMLFVGHGCSRCYEVDAFPGFQEGIYFLDDLHFYDVSRILRCQEYLCHDNGKYTLGQPPVVSRCFWPDQVMSNYSSPVWLLPEAR